MGVAVRRLHADGLASVAVARAAPGDSADRVAAARAIRAAVWSLAGTPVAITTRARPGRPRLVRMAGGRRLRVSVAHREGRAAAAVAVGGARVGVDVERADAVDGAHVGYFLTTRERAALRWHAPAALWALKEAAWKALELRPSVPFLALELELDGGGVLRAATLGGIRRKATAALVAPWRGWVLAVVRIGTAGCDT